MHALRDGRRVHALIAAMAVLSIAGCAGSDDDARPVLHVAAAASLTDVMTELASVFEREHEVDVVLRFGASSMLARQVEAGAPARVLVSADPRWVDGLVEAQLARAEDRAVIATNSLVAIVPEGAALTPRDLRGLLALPHVAVAGAEVPAGMHARRALEHAGLLEDAQPQLVESADVRAALAWVARAEADAAIVYATDARIEPRVRVAFALDRASHEPIVIEAVALRSPAAVRGSHRDPDATLARAFVDFLGTPASREALVAAGFGPP